MLNLSSPIDSIHKISTFQKKSLERMSLSTIGDILRHFPSRYGEAGVVKAIEFLKDKEKVVIFGKISNLKIAQAFRSKKNISKAVLEDSTGKVGLIWFNQPYIAKIFKENSLVRIEGLASQKDNKFYFLNPKIEKIKTIPEIGQSLFAKNVVNQLSPVYPESKGISSNWFYHIMQKIIRSEIFKTIEDPIPQYILKKYNLPSLKTSLIWIHNPRKEMDFIVAKKRFAFEEIFLIQLDRQKEKYLAQKEKSFIISSNKKDIDQFIKNFPFRPTNAQRGAVDTILSDFKKDYPMSRLLEGDVGSGKTAVGATASFAVINNSNKNSPKDLQIAYMAPTEILAEQHFNSFIEYFSEYKIKIGLITGSGAKKFPSKTNKDKYTSISKNQLLKWVTNGEIQILIGTHSLIQKKVKFKNLAFIIIDEQHRFGVKQRKELRKKNDLAPHLLSMTATPIPRTLALTIFGDLDLSLLDELPEGRQPPETKIILPQERDGVYEKIKEEIKKGRQVYVICPRVYEPDPNKELVVNAKSVTEEAKRLKEKIFREFKIGSITGKMKPKEKEEVMTSFRLGKIDILVATSVIEVGVNVQNATLMIIENAERFGLAQLHQLRGRILRSSHKPYCFIFTESKSGKTIERLRSFIKAKNGFELAEADLQQRGTGDLAGSKQWGVSDLAMEALKNIKMVEAAREEARILIEEDFELKKYPLLEKHISQKKTVHME